MRSNRFPSLFVLVAALGALLAPAVSAQRPNIRWGQIPEEHLALTSFPADTNAAAVVLAEVSKVRYTEDLDVVYDVLRRVKLLRPSAFDEWGTVRLYLSRGERVEDIEAQTFVPDPAGGAPQRFRLARGGVFRETIRRGLQEVKFTLPNLAPGAVIEYRYTRRHEDPTYLPMWRFQHGEPTLWSELRVNIPELLSFTTLQESYTSEDLVLNESERTMDGRVRGMEHRWGMANIPALREEPFMTTPDDFRRAIRFQLSAVNISGWNPQQMSNSWPKLGEELMGREGYLTERLRQATTVRDQAAALTQTAATPLDKMLAIYRFVSTNITFDGIPDVFPDKSAEEVLRAKRGTSPEVNTLLVAMLRAAGLEASPALISTRDHGRVIQAYPIVSQFNDLIAFVAIGEQTYLLDATDPLRPASMLPPNSLGGPAWVVDASGGQWVPITSRASHRSLTAVTATLDAAGTLTGTVSKSEGDYGALKARRGLRDVSDLAEHVRKEWLGNLSGLTVTEPVLHDREVIDRPIRLEAGFTLENAAAGAGDMLYFIPQVFGRVTENPLKLPTRTFPVDLSYGRDHTYTLTLTLPEGFEVAETPARRSIGIDGVRGQFSRTIIVEGREVRANYRFQLPDPVYQASAYLRLQRWWNEVVAMSEEPIVLRRAETGASTGGN